MHNASPNAFLAAMNSCTETERGGTCLASTSAPLLDLFFKLVCGLSSSELEGLFARAAAVATTPEAKSDLVVLTF